MSAAGTATVRTADASKKKGRRTNDAFASAKIRSRTTLIVTNPSENEDVAAVPATLGTRTKGGGHRCGRSRGRRNRFEEWQHAGSAGAKAHLGGGDRRSFQILPKPGRRRAIRHRGRLACWKCASRGGPL